jgi:predicted MFS family arabinose efflux permease
VPLGGAIASILLPGIAMTAGWRLAVRCVAIAAIAVALLFWAVYRDPSGGPVAEHAADEPSIYRSRRFLAATGCALTLQAAQACTLTYLAVDIHKTVGLPADTAALFLAVALVGAVIGRVGWGTVGDWIGNRRALTGVSALAAFCCCLMSFFVSAGANLFAVAAICLVLGLAAMSWNAVYINLVTTMAPRRSIGSSLGTGLSVVLLGFSVAPVFGRVADVTNSFRPAWLALAVLVACGTGMSFLARTPRPAWISPS